MNSCVSVDRCAFARPFEGRFVAWNTIRNPTAPQPRQPRRFLPSSSLLTRCASGRGVGGLLRDTTIMSSVRDPSMHSKRHLARWKIPPNSRCLRARRVHSITSCGSIPKDTTRCIEARKHRARYSPRNARATPFAGICRFRARTASAHDARLKSRVNVSIERSVTVPLDDVVWKNFGQQA